MHPAWKPINEVISGTADLDFVSRRLITSGFHNFRVETVAGKKGQVISPTIPSLSAQSSRIFNFDDESASSASTPKFAEVDGPTSILPVESSSSAENMPAIMHLTSPDSDIQCVSRECPIKDVEHNLGRYFHEGERVFEDLESPDLRSPYACGMVAIHRFFSFTMPPPDIVAAYLRMHEGKASQYDKDRVGEYKTHHAWSSIHSEPSTPRPEMPNEGLQVVHAHVLPHESDEVPKRSHNTNTGIKKGSYIAKLNDHRSRGQSGPLPTERRAPCAADFEDTDDEDWMSVNSDIHGSTVELSSVRNLSIHDDQAEVDEAWSWWSNPPKARREVPRGAELVAVQRTLQKKILDRIAEE